MALTIAMVVGLMPVTPVYASEILETGSSEEITEDVITDEETEEEAETEEDSETEEDTGTEEESETEEDTKPEQKIEEQIPTQSSFYEELLACENVKSFFELLMGDLDAAYELTVEELEGLKEQAEVLPYEDEVTRKEVLDSLDTLMEEAIGGDEGDEERATYAEHTHLL